MNKRTLRWLLCGILLLAATMRVWDLAGPDMLGDDAHYSLRAVGYFDWVASLNTQTTPVVWFAEPVWWQHFSFHDAPPFTFAVQWFFFQLFGVNQWAARLPFLIAGLAAIWGMYLLGKEFSGKQDVGLLAALVLAVANYHIWISRIGLIDGLVMLWVVFSLYFFLKAERDPRSYIFWGIMLGLGLLTKYTFLFMGPVFLVPLIWWRRGAWRNKYFWVGVVAFIVLITPLIIYNSMMWVTRGHPDAALSTMLGMHPEDFRGLTREVGVRSSVLTAVLQSMRGEMSIFLQLTFVIGILVAFVSLARAKGRHNFYLLAAGLISGLFILGLAGGSAHYNVALLPFVILASILGVRWLWEVFRMRWQRMSLLAIAFIILSAETVFALQSQLFSTSLIPTIGFANSRPHRLGYTALEQYIDDFYRRYSDPSYIVFAKTPQIANHQVSIIQSFYAEGKNLPQQTELLIYDDRMDWAAGVWTFERRRLYNVAAIPSLTNFLQAVDESYIHKFLEFGFKNATVILATDQVPYNQTVDIEGLSNFTDRIRTAFDPVHEIKNPAGETAFEVYQFSLGDTLYDLFLKNTKLARKRI